MKPETDRPAEDDSSADFFSSARNEPDYTMNTGGEKLAHRHRRERVIRAVWFICALFAVITIFFIFTFLFLDAYPIFRSSLELS